jgi:hypothetical protein
MLSGRQTAVNGDWTDDDFLGLVLQVDTVRLRPMVPDSFASVTPAPVEYQPNSLVTTIDNRFGPKV